MGLTVELEVGRQAFIDSVDALLRAVEGFDEHGLLGASRCHGWTRLDVVTHLVGGWQEMLGGMVSVVDGPTTVDAATYWPGFAEEYGGDPIGTLMAQRRRTAVYARPASAVEHLREAAGMVRRGAVGMREGHHTWQEHVFTAGDYLAIWAVEDAIHHLDLLSGEPAPASALELSRATIEAVAGPLPATWSTEEAVLIGTGRLPVPDGLGDAADRLPALG